MEIAVDRALKPLREDAVRDVEAILDAALIVAERCAPAAPRVADIVAEAGTSNQAFYRYFTGKDDLMQAVMARGLRRVRAYLEHLMSRTSQPQEQVEQWIRGLLTQATNPTAARQSSAVTEILSGSHRRPDTRTGEATVALLDLLLEPLTQLGSTAVELDALAIYEATMGTMNRHLMLQTVPTKQEAEHLISFCLHGLNLQADGP